MSKSFVYIETDTPTNTKSKLEKVNHELNSLIDNTGEIDVVLSLEFSFIPKAEFLEKNNNELYIYSYFTKEYENILIEFLNNPQKASDRGSLLLNPNNFNTGSDNEFRQISGATIFDKKKLVKSGVIQFSEYNSTATEDDWINVLKEKKYGKSHFWYKNDSNSDFFLSTFVLLDVDLIDKVIEQKIIEILQKFLLNDGFSIIFERVRITQKKLLHQSSRSAIAQVVNRNMSHNVGSHVLSRLVVEQDVKGLFNNQIFNPKQFEYEFANDDNVQGDEISNIYKQTALFFSYQKSLMDYLADVSTTVPTVETPKLFVGDVLKGFCQNFILREYVSGVADFNYSFSFKVFGKEYGKEDFRDVMVSIPNDILGCQAVYNILINIIRNTAKHGKPGGKVKFTIELKECPWDSSLYEIRIYDDIFKPANEINQIARKRNEGFNKPIIDSQTNELRNGEWGILEMEVSACYLRKEAPESIDSSEEFELDEVNIKQPWELDSLESYTVPATKINLIHAFKKGKDKQSEEDKGSLGYRFFLMKPKEVIVLHETDDFRVEDKKALSDKGVLILKKDDSTKSEWSYDDKRVDVHPFLLYLVKEDKTQAEIEDFLSEQEGALPHKVVVVVPDGFQVNENGWQVDGVPEKPQRQIAYVQRNTFDGSNINFNGIDLLKEWLWHRWLLNRCGYFQIKKIDNTFNDEYLIKRKIGQDFTLTFNHHGESTKWTNESNHYEAFGSVVKHWIGKFEKEKFVFYSFLDASLQNVVILDERIQEYCYSKNLLFDANISEHFKRANIFIPDTTTLNLSAKNFDDTYIDTLQNWLKSTSENHSNSELNNEVQGIDYVIIHLGIVEKLITSRSDTNTSFEKNNVTNFINELFGKKRRRGFKLIIDSGRGKPSNLPKDVCFLNYSILSQYCIDQRLKFLLINALSSARKHKEL